MVSLRQGLWFGLSAGHPGLSFYIIVSGAVSVQVAETDQQTGVVTTQVCFQS